MLAFAHGFFYSSGLHGHNDKTDIAAPLVPQKTAMGAMFRTLHDSRATVLVAGHDHHYEQLGRAGAGANPADRGQAAMVPDGVRSFVVGTGGKTLYSRDYQSDWAFTEAYDMKSYGILKIELFPARTVGNSCRPSSMQTRSRSSATSRPIPATAPDCLPVI